MKPNGYDSCEQIKSYYSIYSVPQAAALWCGVPQNQLNDHLSKAQEISKGVWSLSYMDCLAPRCRAIHEAINNDLLPACRENGFVVKEHIAPERRHIRREDLKAWITKNFPDDKPDFLFDETEKKAHPSITIESYTALQADRDAIKIENEKLKFDNRAKSEVIANMEMQIKSMEACFNKMPSTQLSETEKNTMLKVIIGMAIDAYGYKPSSNRNQATGDKNGISAKLQTHGISITDDTIRKYLTEAKDLIQPSIPMTA